MKSGSDSRVSKLHGWLLENLGDAWRSCLKTRNLDPDGPMTKFQATEISLLANYAIRTHFQSGNVAAASEIYSLPLLKTFEHFSLPDVKIVFDHDTLRSDLIQLYHPSLPTGSVVPAHAGSETLDFNEIEKASQILDIVPELRAEALRHLSAICFVKSDVLRESGECISTSNKLVPGLIYTSDVPAILLAEAIIHESAHLQLFQREAEASLYIDQECSIQTPLRTDLRPPSGLLHQAFVLTRLKAYYRVLESERSTTLEQNQRQISKRFRGILSEFEQAQHSLVLENHRYTETGKGLIREILDG